MANLGELVEIVSGFAFKSSQFSDEGGLPLIRIRDVKRGFTETHYVGEYSSEFLVNDGDLLVGMDGEFNAERWKGGKALLNQRVCKIVATSPELHEQYLYYFLPKQLKLIEDATPSVTVKHLSAKTIRDIEIPLPPLEEQKRIAAILDKADAIRRKRQQAIDLTDQLLRSVFLDMFGDPVTNPKGWETGSFADIAEINPKTPKLDDALEVSFVPMQVVSENSDEIDLSEIRTFGEVKKGFTPFRENDVLFAKITPCMENGKAGIARNLINEIGFGSTEFHVFRPRKKHYAEFIYTLIHFEHFRDIAASKFTGAVGHKRVPKDFLEKFPVMLPPDSEVNKYFDIFRYIKEIRKKNSSTLETNGNLFNALSQKAFRGELSKATKAA